MKKILLIPILILMSFILIACQEKTMPIKLTLSDYMYTFISIDIKQAPLDMEEEIKENLQQIFQMYHELATNEDPLPVDSTYLENIYSINQKTLQKLEIDEPLYMMLKKSLEYHELTEGHFDVSIGKIIDVWKETILDEMTGYVFDEIPEEVFNQVLEDVDKIEVIDEPFTLTEESGKYYIRINHEDVKIDLGAVAKGYATQVAADYIQSLGIQNYSITSGSSSIVLGKNPDRDGEIFIISLANPLRTGTDDRSYGKVHVKDASITTSGNYEQYATYEGLRYHHIISPATKKPMHYYHTITIIGQDAGLLDAISTAMLSMSPEVLDAWLDLHQEELEIEVIRFNYDGSITKNLTNTELLDA
ncbi:MAG: FAD:protein FMN transferase [Acholeplasmataceae bacterium]|nr:FAD:protein FMN transferase [Acholeplasmataceae bacterium]